MSHSLFLANLNGIDRKDSAVDPIACGIMFKRDCLIKLGLYDAEFRRRQEKDLMLRFNNSGYKKLHLPIPLYR